MSANNDDVDPPATRQVEPSEPHASDVGFAKPPRHSQFRPGQSGNPSGRPRKSLSLSELTAKVGGKTRRINEGGRVRDATYVELMLESTFRKSINGDIGAVRALLAILARAPAVAQRTLTRREHHDEMVEELTPEDLALAAGVGRVLAEYAGEPSSPELNDAEGDYDLDVEDEQDDEIYPAADDDAP